MLGDATGFATRDSVGWLEGLAGQLRRAAHRQAVAKAALPPIAITVPVWSAVEIATVCGGGSSGSIKNPPCPLWGRMTRMKRMTANRCADVTSRSAGTRTSPTVHRLSCELG